jgi:PAS domain S-box-containing protein
MNTTIFTKEIKQAEQAVQEYEQRYKRLVSSVTDYVYSVSVHHRRPEATAHGPGCEAVTGYTSKEFEADPYLWYRMIYSEDRPAVTAQAERVLNGETPPPLEHRILHKDGRLRWIRNTPVPRKDAQATLVGYDGMVSDITERKRARQFLAVQYAVTRNLGEASSLDEALTRILESVCETFQGFLWTWQRYGVWMPRPMCCGAA